MGERNFEQVLFYGGAGVILTHDNSPYKVARGSRLVYSGACCGNWDSLLIPLAKTNNNVESAKTAGAMSAEPQ